MSGAVNTNNKNQEYWEQILAEENLSPIDNQCSKGKNSRDLSSIESIESIFNIKIHINKNDESITFFDEQIEVGKMGISSFSRKNVENNRHLFFSIGQNYRKKGYGTALLKAFLLAGFHLPEKDFNDKISGVKFLLGTGYYELESILDEEGNHHDDYICDIFDISGEEQYDGKDDESPYIFTLVLKK